MHANDLTRQQAPPAEEQGRRPYCTPLLGRIGLEADQVLGVGCKSQVSINRTGVAPLGGCCGISPCSSWGS
jgi:hypothetical protein